MRIDQSLKCAVWGTVLFCGMVGGGMVGGAWAQTPDLAPDELAKEVSTRMGMNQAKRFESGANPITIERTSIVPGTPLEIKSTMQNMIEGGSARSFGGILGRYNTEQFGKFFVSGTMDERMFVEQNDIEQIDLGDNVVENVEDVARMYPPRLFVDEAEIPSVDIRSPRVQEELKKQMNNIQSRLQLDPQTEKIVLLQKEDTLVIEGNVRSEDTALTVQYILALEPGVNNIENRLTFPAVENQNRDLLGNPIP